MAKTLTMQKVKTYMIINRIKSKIKNQVNWYELK